MKRKLIALLVSLLFIISTFLPVSTPVFAASGWSNSATGGFGVGANRSCESMAEYGGKLYAGTYNINGCEVYVSDGTSWTRSATGGFGDTSNTFCRSMAEYGGKLYAGTVNGSGCEVYVFDGTSWTRSATGGFGVANNVTCSSMGEFKGKLYAGTSNDTTGSEVYVFDGTSWTRSATGGFGVAANTSCASMAESGGKLFAGVNNITTGSEVYVFDGTSWTRSATGGFGVAANERCPSMAEYGGKIYTGTMNNSGCEVWRTAEPVIHGCHPTSVVQGHTVNVDITGSHTNFKDGTSVAQFSGTGITVNSTHVTDSIHAMANITVAPGAPVGYRDVNVVTGAETPEPLKNVFTVKQAPPAPPRLDSLDPMSGTVGTHVKLSGEHFGASQGHSYVTFNGTDANFYHSWSDGKIVCQVPSGATSGLVTVTTTAGTSNGIYFTVQNVGTPRIKDCNPRTVYQGHEVELHILGENTHFANGTSQATVSGTGVIVDSTFVSDPTHATAHIKVEDNANPGTREVNVVTGAETPEPLKNVFTIKEKHSQPPAITSLHPADGQVGTRVSVVGERFGDVMGSSTVTFNGVPVANYVSWSDHEVVCSVPMGATTGDAEVHTPWGTSDGHHFTVDNSTFYFAEGTCRPGFDPYICIQNPGATAADVTITYMLGDGTTDTEDLTVGANSRSTVVVKDTLGEGDDPAHDFSSKVECTNNQQIIVERPMYFNYKGKWTGGSDVVGALSPAQSFYFAEGTCRSGFDPYLTIQNPQNSEADVRITYMRGDGSTSEQNLTVPATARSTVFVEDTLGEGDDAAHDFSSKVECTNNQQIIAERPMYFSYGAPKGLSWTGGSDVVGALSPAETFYFAEGTCRPGFDPYLTIQNPAGVEAQVVITYMRGDGTTQEQALDVPAHSRATVTVTDILGSGDSPAYDFSCKVESTNNVNIIAERPMYFNYKGVWTGGHDVVGALSPSQSFYFAEGTTRPEFQPYLTIQNPELAAAQVRITYMLGNGTTSEQVIAVPAQSRYTVVVADFLGVGNDAAHDFSARVECFNNKGIIAERPMYFNYKEGTPGYGWTGGHDVVGFAP